MLPESDSVLQSNVRPVLEAQTLCSKFLSKTAAKIRDCDAELPNEEPAVQGLRDPRGGSRLGFGRGSLLSLERKGRSERVRSGKVASADQAVYSRTRRFGLRASLGRGSWKGRIVVARDAMRQWVIVTFLKVLLSMSWCSYVKKCLECKLRRSQAGKAETVATTVMNNESHDHGHEVESRTNDCNEHEAYGTF